MENKDVKNASEDKRTDERTRQRYDARRKSQRL